MKEALQQVQHETITRENIWRFNFRDLISLRPITHDIVVKNVILSQVLPPPEENCASWNKGPQKSSHTAFPIGLTWTCSPITVFPVYVSRCAMIILTKLTTWHEFINHDCLSFHRLFHVCVWCHTYALLEWRSPRHRRCEIASHDEDSPCCRVPEDQFLLQVQQTYKVRKQVAPVSLFCCLLWITYRLAARGHIAHFWMRIPLIQLLFSINIKALIWIISLTLNNPISERDEVSVVDYCDEQFEQGMRENEKIAKKLQLKCWKNLREMKMNCHRLTWSHGAEMFSLHSTLGELTRSLTSFLREQPQVS